MKAKIKSPKRSVPVSMSEDEYRYIINAGVGKNFSEKARSIINLAKKRHDIIVKYDGSTLVHNSENAICVYTEGDGERIWGEIPFTFNKKLGWRKIVDYVHNAGYVCQVVEVEDDGFVAVWIAKSEAAKNCEMCRAKILELLS